MPLRPSDWLIIWIYYSHLECCLSVHWMMPMGYNFCKRQHDEGAFMQSRMWQDRRGDADDVIIREQIEVQNTGRIGNRAHPTENCLHLMQKGQQIFWPQGGVDQGDTVGEPWLARGRLGCGFDPAGLAHDRHTGRGKPGEGGEAG